VVGLRADRALQELPAWFGACSEPARQYRACRNLGPSDSPTLDIEGMVASMAVYLYGKLGQN
jgi:hypothetical protein